MPCAPHAFSRSFDSSYSLCMFFLLMESNGIASRVGLRALAVIVAAQCMSCRVGKGAVKWPQTDGAVEQPA